MSLSAIINILSCEKESVGTGFFVSPNGYIITCNHVINKAGYSELGKFVSFKYANDSFIHIAKLIMISEAEDLALLYSNEKPEKYIPLCNRNITGSMVETYGFPNSSEIEIKAIVSFDRIYGNEKYIQLGNANSVTFGFSGAPIIYEGAAVGIIQSASKTDPNGRLTELAFAISAKSIMEIFPKKYIFTMELCIGYGNKAEICSNYAISKSEGLCKECYENQFLDAVKSLYVAQNYCIHICDGYFITELKYGFSKYYDAVFTLVKFDESITTEDIYYVIDSIKLSKYNISQIVIVTNSKRNVDAARVAKDNKITIKTKEELLCSMFDFEPYKLDLERYVNSKELSNHYIEVYGTSVLAKDNESNDNEIYKNQDELWFDYFDDEYDNDSILLESNESEDFKNYKDECFCCFDEDYEQDYVEESPKILLKEYVNEFLVSKHRALLILGDYGSGKTSFCYNYAFELLDKFIKDKSNFLPILIKLRNYNKAVGISQLLTDYFVNDLGINNFNFSSFKLLLKNINVVLIFDGYDEVAKKVDFDIKYDVLKEICNLAESNTKIIVTCRPNYFQNASEFKRIFQNSHFPYEPGEKPLIEFIENSIEELDATQIYNYIKSYQSELEKTNISIKEMLKTIANTHDLTDLSKRPFLLYMILSTLPKILKEVKDKGHTKINASKLYSVYTDNWIKREDSKNKTLIKKSDKELFCKEFAFELYTTNAESLSYRDFPDTIKKYFKDIVRIEDVDYFSHDIQSCSFLTSDRTGDFKFIHKSFMEYFVSDRVISKLSDCIKKTKNSNKKINDINNILGNTYFSMEICLFINDILNLTQNKVLKNIVYFFKDINVVAKANLLSIIAKSKTNMSNFLLKYNVSDVDITHVDFSNAKFIGGIFKNISFNNIQFYSVLFEGVTFINCNFSGSIFEKSELKELKFYNCNFNSSEWRGINLKNCNFNDEDDILTLKSENLYYNSYNFCDFENSMWQDSSIVNCSFNGCDFVENKMRSMIINKSTFCCVDFSGTDILGKFDIKDNNFYEVTGKPYEF